MFQGQDVMSRILLNMERVMVGKTREVGYVLAALICQGHVLIEDVPGVGKTTLVRALARSLGCEFRRIQFTPDLLPSDVTGVSIYNQHSGEFEFRPGPILAQIILADEINRTSPKTQSALLECMEERQVTVDGVSHQLPTPFLVLATQNPIEYEGTFPLPEAQLDRFLLRVRLGYPSMDEEKQIIARSRHTPVNDLPQVATGDEILALQEAVKDIYCDPAVTDYLVRVVQRSREHKDIYLGASPRAAIGLHRAAQALAGLRGRDFVIPDDIKEMAPLVLAHRLIVRPEAQLRGADAAQLVGEILQAVAVPVGVKSYARPA